MFSDQIEVKMTHENRILTIVCQLADRHGLTVREEVRAAFSALSIAKPSTRRTAFYRGLSALKRRGLIIEDDGVIELQKPTRGSARCPTCGAPADKR